ncbi:arylsulfatase [Pelagicoccus mobilis]|uniref:Arylsulfatase n=1 Tax=Pelagicoccus mobilis TaxID=415221 RepID=A0A934S3S8_9BACT|nr:arylsulfatase [Pelagicoccus mobilis]MBK1880171.1 arylsulfatase [Pelagicoccus mobilis]
MKRLFPCLLAALCLLSIAATAAAPNVVIVITDDQGYGNLSAVGHPILKTPHIDALYDRGVRFTDYHVDPTCAPTRSALLTGRYSDRVGVWHTVIGRHQLRPREVTLAEVFRDNGYATGIFGKWHLGDLYPFRPQDRGFEDRVVHAAGGVGQGPDFWGNDYFDDVYDTNDGLKQYQGFCTDVFFDESIKFMKEQASKGKPFFTYVSTNAPHGPYWAKDSDHDRFKGMKHNGKPLGVDTEKYYAMIENIDDNFGKLVKFLKKEGLYENTILVFTSDNGAVTSGQKVFNGGLKGGKNTNWDGGHQVPWIMQWPAGKVEGGKDLDRVTAHIDIMPTLIDICKLDAPKIEFDGKSLKPLLKNVNAKWPSRRIVVESQRVYDPIKYRNFAVLSDKWRLVGKDKLFDARGGDRGQENDVASKNPEAMQSMLDSYEEFWADVSREHHLVTSPEVGADASNPAVLNSHDWTTVGFWHQNHIRDPFKQKAEPFGSWVMDVTKSGWYQISVRRWAAEADVAITEAYVGQAVEAATASLEIQGKTLKAKVAPGAKEVTFRVKLKKGPAELKATFYNSQKEATVSPFYAYVLREDGRDLDGWQTREGLGLPQAAWPEVPGRDPSVN